MAKSNLTAACLAIAAAPVTVCRAQHIITHTEPRQSPGMPVICPIEPGQYQGMPAIRCTIHVVGSLVFGHAPFLRATEPALNLTD
eukprot:1159974-Pelagomonas_calceolata.AAC.7